MPVVELPNLPKTHVDRITTLLRENFYELIDDLVVFNIFKPENDQIIVYGSAETPSELLCGISRICSDIYSVGDYKYPQINNDQAKIFYCGDRWYGLNQLRKKCKDFNQIEWIKGNARLLSGRNAYFVRLFAHSSIDLSDRLYTLSKSFDVEFYNEFGMCFYG